MESSKVYVNVMAEFRQMADYFQEVLYGRTAMYMRFRR